MIPLKLELRNFLSYGEDHPPLSLEGVHVACLSGPNGHGKSALLDALVWALWGESRGGARAGDDLIRHGAREMEVAVEFELHGVRHRVTRRRTLRGKAGSTDLQLQSWDGRGWRTYTGGSLAETQRAITDLLHMTHNTFVHASFIAQGKADAFMLLTPQHRKQVLGEILDLGKYDQLTAAAREGGRRARAEVDRLTATIAEIDAELQRREEYQRREAEAARIEREAGAIRDRLAAEREGLLAEVERLRAVEREAQGKERAWRSALERTSTLERQLRDLARRVEEATVLVEQAGAIEERFARYTSLEEQEHALAARFEPWRTTQEALRAAEAAIDRERTRLETEVKNALRRATELERLLQEAEEAAAAREQLLAQLRTYDELEKQLAETRERARAIADDLAVLQQEGQRLRRASDEYQQRIALLGSHEECPLCGQVLGPDGLAAARRRLSAEHRAIEEQLVETRQTYAQRAADAKAAEEQQRAIETKLTGRALVQRSLGSMEHRIRDAENYRKQLDELNREVATSRAALESGDFAADYRAQREAAERRLAEIGYDPMVHRRLREERARLRGAADEMRQLDVARTTLATAASHRADLESQRRAAQAEANALHDEFRRLAEEATRLAEVSAQLASKESELQEAGAAFHRASQVVGEARQMVAWLATREQEREARRQELLAARQDVSAFDQLAEAFGKNGIQEMLVELALPEIEEHANELLGRLTGGRMRIELRTQRAGRTGGVISTLDVNVADEQGVRPYELFSGGERFRIDFAIRIALSRYLANRAGAPLQMLAIDEGFGSQDREGCDRLVEAIRSIEDDFKCILVITHLPEIRDLFPIRIEVTKTARGSTFAIA